MEQKNLNPSETIPARQWHYRILSASLFGILFFTLFPYWIDFSRKHAAGRSPFLLGGPLHFDGVLHTFLNALLFAPFGFALSQFFGRRNDSLLKSLALAVIAGGALSDSIEMIQLYMPSRDSAWDDVLANTSGALLGMIFGLIAGDFILRKLSEWESQLGQLLSLRKLFVAALIYFGVWLAISIPLQKKTHLDNWDPNSFLVVGYDANSGTRWSGAVSRVHLWNRAFAADQATVLSADSNFIARSSAAANPLPLATYDLSQTPPVASGFGTFPNLALRPLPTFSDAPHQSRKSATASVLMSESSVPALAADVRHSNQFAVSIDCVPSRGDDTDGAIFAVTNLSGKPDFVLRQEISTLVIFLKNGLDSRKTLLAWRVPGVFTSNVRRSLFFSYDGTQGSLYIDGDQVRKSYYLSPGVALVAEFIRIKTDELVAYSVLYVSLVFLPVGFLLGLAVRIIPRHNSLTKLGIGVAILFPAIALDAVLAGVSGRHMSIYQLSLSIGLTIAGMLWMNLDSEESGGSSRVQNGERNSPNSEPYLFDSTARDESLKRGRCGAIMK